MGEKDLARIGEGWRVVIPQSIREVLDLHKGDFVSFGVENGRVVLRKVIFQEVEA